MVPPLSPEPALIPSPGAVYRGWGIAANRAVDIVRLARQAAPAARILAIGGSHSLPLVQSVLAPAFHRLSAGDLPVDCHWTPYGVDCCETELDRLRAEVKDFGATAILGIGGGEGDRFRKTGGPSTAIARYYPAHLRCHLRCLDSLIQRLF